MPNMPRILSHRPIKVQVPRELYWAIALQAEREGKSMGDVVLQSGWERLRRLKPPKGMFEGGEACG